MTRYTRQEAKLRGFPTCYGSPCPKHPELEGHRSVSGGCVECARAQLRARRAANPDKTRSQRKINSATVRKKRNTDPILRQKHLAKDVAYKKANREKCAAAIVAWSKVNPEKVKEYARRTKVKNKIKILAANKLYVKNNPEVRRASTRAWRQKNKPYSCAQSVKRHAAKLHRTPSWLTTDDHWFIGEIYELAALRTKMFGFAWHVDHIIPLQGKNVSGLHVPLNLRVIPGAENVRKSNQYEVVA